MKIDRLEGIFSDFGKKDALETPEEVVTPAQIEDIVPWLAGKGSLLKHIQIVMSKQAMLHLL